MIPVLTRVRAKTIAEFGDLVRHSGEEYIHVLEGRMEVHTEFYDPIVLETGESVYIDSNMGHAYIAAEGCDEVLLLGVCSSADEQLMESLLTLHGDERVAQQRRPAASAAATPAKAITAAKPSRPSRPSKPSRSSRPADRKTPSRR